MPKKRGSCWGEVDALESLLRLSMCGGVQKRRRDWGGKSNQGGTARIKERKVADSSKEVHPRGTHRKTAHFRLFCLEFKASFGVHRPPKF